jgi:hypothetical protein
MAPNNSALAKIALAVVLMGIAAVCFFRFGPPGEGHDDGAYFYDVAEETLFVAPRGSIPPITGVKGRPAAGVRAVVISMSGDPGDKKNRRIAYLESYTPELKQLFEEVRAARAEGRSPARAIDRGQVPHNTLVRRPKDAEWRPLDSAEGEAITVEWNTPGADGRSPVICTP